MIGFAQALGPPMRLDPMRAPAIGGPVKAPKAVKKYAKPNRTL
jgi:hypothetical protein